MERIECDHGHLKRQCEVCDRDDEIHALQARIAEAKEWVEQNRYGATLSTSDPIAALIEIAEGRGRQIAALKADDARLADQLDTAIRMLAQWCADVEQNGTGWDDWDENFKAARYRPGPLRELLDDAIDAAMKPERA